VVSQLASVACFKEEFRPGLCRTTWERSPAVYVLLLREKTALLYMRTVRSPAEQQKKWPQHENAPGYLDMPRAHGHLCAGQVWAPYAMLD